MEVVLNMDKKMGEWAFIIGVLIAVLLGVLPSGFEGTLTLVLVVLGLIVGFLNVTERETTPFLIAAAVLLITGTTGTSLALIPPMVLGTFLQNAVKNIAVFVAPAAIVVAIKAIQSLAKD